MSEKRFEVRRERATDSNGFRTGKAGQYYIMDTHISDRIYFYPSSTAKEENQGVADHLESLYLAELGMQENITGLLEHCIKAQVYHHRTRELRMLGDRLLQSITELNLNAAKRAYILLGARLDVDEAEALVAWAYAQSALWEDATRNPDAWLRIEVLRQDGHGSPEKVENYRWRLEGDYLAVTCLDAPDADSPNPDAVVIKRQPKKYKKGEQVGFQLAAIEAERLAVGLVRIRAKGYGPNSLPQDIASVR